MMTLAQATTGGAATTSAVETVTTQVPFDWNAWAPTTHSVMRGLTTAAATLIIGVLMIWLLRRLLERAHLRRASVIGALALAFYLGAWGYKPERLATNDDLAYWITRVFATAMLYVVLVYIDRLIIQPLLTHGGRVALPRFVHQILFIVLCLFSIVLFGSVAFGWDIDRFLAGSAVVSIVLGLALQESLGNFFSGLVMQASPPFSIGNWIVCGNFEGRVVDMTWRAVTLHTNDDNFIVIPNATVAKAEITNFHAPTTATARTITVGLESDVAPALALAVLKAAALETEGVQATPEPFVFLDKFGESSVDYAVKFWIIEPMLHRKIEHRVRVSCWYRLREKGVEIPDPRFTVTHVSHSRKATALHERATERFVQAIAKVPLLQPLNEAQMRDLAATANDVLLAAGQILFRQNDAGDSFYVISEGQVEVLVKPEGASEDSKVATLGPGDFFGEMSALTGQPRTATIRAAMGGAGGQGGVTLVQIEKQDLLAIFKRDPGIMEKISEVVARRNAEREAVMQGAKTGPTQEVVVRQQKSLLGRMMSFFRLGAAA